MTIGLKKSIQSSINIQDFGINERDLALLKIDAITRDSTTGKVTQIVESAPTASGGTFTVTTNFNRHPTTKKVSSISVTFSGDGPTVTKTVTYTRDGSGKVSSSAIT